MVMATAAIGAAMAVPAAEMATAAAAAAGAARGARDVSRLEPPGISFIHIFSFQ